MEIQLQTLRSAFFMGMKTLCVVHAVSRTIYPLVQFRRIIFRECIFCCGRWPVGSRVLLHTIPANKRGGGVNGSAEGAGTARHPLPRLSAVLAGNIEYFCRVVKLA